jgi:tyrosyl-tRNA synthetase
MKKFLEIFKERGFFHQATDEKGLAALDTFTAYIGFDCTATSLHVGSLMQIMILRWLKKTGNTPIILLGGATTKVGDPSGKDESRPMITDETIAINKAGIKKVFDKLGLGDCIFVDNLEWFDGIKYLEFLNQVGRHFSVNRMIAKDSVKSRLERESFMSFLEFNYMVLQAYDFVKLAEKYNCRVQIGGSDQWGNITEGVELHRKLDAWQAGSRLAEKNPDMKREEIVPIADEVGEDYYKNKRLFGLTTPLITTSSGAKMGKTADGAVWLDEARVSPYDYYQFWRNTEDADVIKFLKIFTELPIEEIEAMKAWENSAKINDAKKILAFEATKLCHGEAEAIEAEKAAINAFEKGTTEGLPEVKLEAKTYKATELFVAAGLATSNGEARRLIEGGGAKIDDLKVDSPNQEIAVKDGMKLSSGKKKHVVIKLNG